MTFWSTVNKELAVLQQTEMSQKINNTIHKQETVHSCDTNTTTQ